MELSLDALRSQTVRRKVGIHYWLGKLLMAFLKLGISASVNLFLRKTHEIS